MPRNIATTSNLPPAQKTYDGSRVDGAYALNPDRVSTVDWSMSKQWANRPDDERFESFAQILAMAEYWENISFENPVSLANVRITNEMEIILPSKGQEVTLNPTHLAFGQLCEAGSPRAPANFLRQLPAHEAASNLRACLNRASKLDISAYMADGGVHNRVLRSLAYDQETRVTNATVLRQLRPILGDLTGNDGSPWKTPGKIDWNRMEHNPFDMNGQISLFLGDLDMQCFICQDGNPIEIGKTRRGFPDIFFPGLMWGNSEVISQTLWFTAMMLQGVCCNLSLRGVMGKKTYRINHTKNAPTRLIRATEGVFEAATEVDSFVRQVREMKGTRINQITDCTRFEDRQEETVAFLTQRVGLGKRQAEEVMRIGKAVNNHPIETTWDAHEQITEYAKTVKIQGERRKIEYAASSLMPKAA